MVNLQTTIGTQPNEYAIHNTRQLSSGHNARSILYEDGRSGNQRGRAIRFTSLVWLHYSMPCRFDKLIESWMIVFSVEYVIVNGVLSIFCCSVILQNEERTQPYHTQRWK